MRATAQILTAITTRLDASVPGFLNLGLVGIVAVGFAIAWYGLVQAPGLWTRALHLSAL
jgi:hypothetical protein